MSKQSEERQKAILETVERLALELGLPATPQQVADATRIPKTTVDYHVRLLAEAGRLRRHFGGRGLEIVKVEARPDASEPQP